MATQDYAASVQGVAVRITALQSNGALSTTAGDSIVTSAFTRVSFTPEYEEGDEITEKGADGAVCVTYKAATRSSASTSRSRSASPTRRSRTCLVAVSS